MSTKRPGASQTTPADQSVPGPAEPSWTGQFFSADGTALYGEWFETEEPRALALIMHGYAEHCGRYREVANVLAESRLAAFSYDMRGHGRAEGQRGHVNDYGEYLADMNAALSEMSRRAAARYPQKKSLPILLLTHSNGGLVALRALADPFRFPRGVEAAVLSSPFLSLEAEVPLAKQLIGRAAGMVAPTLSLPSGLEIDHLTHDPDKLAERRVDTLCHEVASAGWFTASMEAQEYVAQLAHRITVPTLWLVAGRDRLAKPQVTRAVHGRLRAPSRLVEFPDMYHEVFNEVDRGRVFGYLREFLDSRFSD